MLAPSDRAKIKYCAENNGGKCPYKCRVCDGLCNNCPLNIQPGDKIQTGTAYTPRRVLTYEELNALENRCLPPCYD